jgi:hypothetical protein
MGGMRQHEFAGKPISEKSKEKHPEYEIEQNVYLYNQSKEVWY